MPRLVDVPAYDPLDPYHHEYDNRPIEALKLRTEQLNDAVEIQRDIMTEAIGSQGTLSNRLNQSMEEDGSLKTDAIDAALHSIEEHADTDDYVRMTSAERDKLALIDDEATNVTLTFELGDDTDVSFTNGEVIFENTNSVAWSVTAPNKVRADLGFPVAAAHTHLYDVNPTTDDNLTYSLPTAFIEGSLRVYINGIRLSQYEEVYVPSAIADSQFLVKYTADNEEGTFVLSNSIEDEDVIRADYDISFA